MLVRRLGPAELEAPHYLRGANRRNTEMSRPAGKGPCSERDIEYHLYEIRSFFYYSVAKDFKTQPW
jgi:hypothetical protein